MQKKRLNQNIDDERKDRLRRRLSMLTEEVEESARMLRRARDEVKKVLEELAALEKRYWALLSQVEADEMMSRDHQI